MKLHYLAAATILYLAMVSHSCTDRRQERTGKASKETNEVSTGLTQQVFWDELMKLCGNAYTGTIVAGGENDTIFGNKTLIMHVRSCDEHRIRIPFFVGADSSRTWVLTMSDGGLTLKHDHRHRDGTPDELTMYGGKTTNFGSDTRQFFPADQETADMLPEAIGNIWWIDLVPGEYFSYNLRRVNTPRLFSVRFDLTDRTDPPGKPWGWKD